MKNPTPRVLVVGEASPFGSVFAQLQSSGQFQFDYAADLAELRATARHHERPNVILLALPHERSAAEGALSWLELLKQRAAVVVIGSREEMYFYLASMERGAFDYFTCHTPLPEVVRVLENAAAAFDRQVA